ncbi:MAG TPA: hypothetical protein PKW95_22825 [bacterium]|nr:hypothetical protein [bacterium]
MKDKDAADINSSMQELIDWQQKQMSSLMQQVKKVTETNLEAASAIREEATTPPPPLEVPDEMQQQVAAFITRVEASINASITQLTDALGKLKK